MTPPQAQPASAERARADTASRGAAGAAEGPFVINLRSSTTPMALSQPSDPALARFKFFVSRRLEDGRERFRLHMGYFETLAEAEEWLTVVREIYPGAWAGEAPGKRLKAQAAGSSVSSGSSRVSQPSPRATQLPPSASQSLLSASQPPSAAQPSLSASGPSRSASERSLAVEQSRGAVEQRSAAVIPFNVPVLRAAPGAVTEAAATAATEARAGSAASSGSTVSSTPTASPRSVAPTPVALPRPAAPAAPEASSRRPAQGALAASTAAASAATASTRPAARDTPSPAATPKASAAARGAAWLPAGKSAARPSRPKSAGPALPHSNVREVLAELDETGATRQMPAPVSAGSRAQAELERSLTDTQVLKLLEARRVDGGRAEEPSGISVLKPDDTGTRRALKEAVATNAPVSFAVQLQWSVQPIDISKVPPLAIFSAYTLYTVEGSREGRRWYGLRLGFFSDAVSAKQVAHYVRSEFNSVAVVPVSPQERSRATEGGKSAPPPGREPAKPLLRDRLPEPTTEFKLIDDEPSLQSVPAARTAEPEAAAAKPKATRAAASSKRPTRGPVTRVRAREKRAPQTLEETLEILGADQLEIDQGRDATLNDTGVRHLSVQVRKNSPFARLLDRLAERARGK